MYSKTDLLKQLELMGLKDSDSIMIHSSMKSIGEVDGRADTVLDVFSEYFNKGLLMFPTHTWEFMDEDNNLFDVNNQRSCVGILPELFRKRPNVFRSYHPTHSIGILGSNAKEYIKNEEDSKTPCSPNGVWGRLADIDAKIMLLGCTHGTNTYIHSIEESFDVTNRIAKEGIKFIIKDNDIELERVFHKHHSEGMSNLSLNYDKAKDLLELKGIVKTYKFGDATVLLMSARKLKEFILKMLEIDPHVFDTRDSLETEKFININM